MGRKSMTSLGGRLSPISIPILTARLALRLPKPSDVPFLMRRINDPAVFRPLASRHAHFKESEEVEWVRGSRSTARKGEKLNLAITLRETGVLIGGIGLEIRDWDNGRGWIGYWLAKPYWHRGYASEAASAVCQIAFRRLKLHRIDAAVFEFNPRSARILRRLGFRREGIRRDVLFRDGRWHREFTFGLLAQDFRPKSRRFPSARLPS